MPRYHFHICDDEVADDEEGLELPDLAAVRGAARAGICDLVCESVRKGHLNLNHYILVTDEHGTEVLKMTFREAFRLTG